MTQYLPASLRALAFPRRIAVLFILAAVAVVAPQANAAKPVARKHPRLHAMARAFVNATLPAAGLVPVEEEDVPEEGQKYELKLVHGHTNEALDVVYRIGDTYIPEALDELNLFLRDTHNLEVNAYDPRTFDVLHTMLAKVGKPNGVISVLSGYRSQETNDELRESGTTNAAEHSQHIVAKAVDLRVDGVPAARLRDAAKSLEAGGVGYYPKAQFVHIDTGPVREWTYSGHAHRVGHGRGRARRHRHA